MTRETTGLTMSDKPRHAEEAHLDEFYKQEVYEKISTLEEALLYIDQNGRFEENLKKILSSCMQIMDLGMIHGYEGVEAIAESMYAAARYCAWQGAESIEEVRKKLLTALETLKQVVELTDPTETQQLIDKTRVEMDFKIDDVMPHHHEERPDEIWSEPVRRKTLGMQSSELIHLKDFSEDQEGDGESEKVSRNGAYAHTPKQEIDEDKINEELEAYEGADEEEQPAGHEPVKSFVEGEIELIEHALDEILINKVHLILDRLEEAIDQVETGIDVELSLQDIKDACEELKTLSLEIQLQPLSRLIYGMHELAYQYLEKDIGRLEAISLLREGAGLLQDYLHRKKIETRLLLDYQNQFERFQNKVSQKEQQLNQQDDEVDFDQDIEILDPPKLPFIVRLKRLFGMY